jgi:aldehyde:ferredoxin oxidoreductase
MEPISEKVGGFGGGHGWANRILRIDLSNMHIEVQEASPYLPETLGARGIATRIVWDEYPEPAKPFDPANPLMVFAGALTGSHSPYSGRTNVCAFSPQAYPHPWFTRSSVGGHFGGELKRAGYDGIVVTGTSEMPVRISIRDDNVDILPAGELWGQDTMDTLEALVSAEGRAVRSLVIGPAGERLSRIATIQTASSSACGQGGFGAVMGSKKLKAISVAGSGHVTLAQPETITSIARTLVRIFAEDGQTGPLNFYGDIGVLNQQLAARGDGKAVCRACTDACITPCVAHFQDMPGDVYDRKWSGDWGCVGRTFLGPEEDAPPPQKSIYDWRLPRRAAFELNALSNRYGLNQFDLLIGMVPWLIACQKAGLISEINGRAMDWRSATFWADLLRAIAYREGLGDVLAEGGWAAARTLGMGETLAQYRYPGWGHTAHCDAFGWGGVTFPFWLVSALQWLADTRDPFNSGHGYLWAADVAERAAELANDTERAAALDRIRAIGQRVYGSADAVDPCSSYKDKAYPGYYQTLRSVIKDSVPVDAHFPLIYREKAPDGYWRLPDIVGVGEIEGPAIEYHLFAAGTGVPWCEEEFMRAAERVCTLERALQVRHWARDRRMDEMVLPYFEQTELYQNPFLDRRYGLDRERFRPVMDEFYALHGWDVKDGWPTRERLRELDLEDLYEPMLAGASARRATAGCTLPDPNCRSQRFGASRKMVPGD